MKKIDETRTKLSASSTFCVRFSEVDAMGIVWHGNYALYFEDVREKFDKKYGISFYDIKRAGFGAPLVELSFKYKQPLQHGQTAVATVFYHNTEAAKVIFEYEIRDRETGMLLTAGRSVQVFVDRDNQLVITNPTFYLDWKKKNGL
jgi:acyl-CoA thioester hydrolase